MRGVIDDRIRRAPAHPPQRAATSTSGNYDDERERSIAFEESLARLVKDGHVDREDALEFAVHPDELKSRLRPLAS